ncbi:hypothetical protein M569_07909, partial [Genlisea aurea]
NAGFFRSASAFMNILVATMKMVADYYPCRLYKAFVVDPPSFFPVIWKGVKPFLELSSSTHVIQSIDYDDLFAFKDHHQSRGAASFLHGFEAGSVPVPGSSSSRFSFTVSHHLDSLKPWYLSLKDSTKVGPAAGPMISPSTARSRSFASPSQFSVVRRGLFPSTPMPQKTQPCLDHPGDAFRRRPRTPKPSFLNSPAMAFFRRESREGDSFANYIKFYRRPYDEMAYRSKMRPPLGGLISIVSPQIRRRHVSISQRF